MKENDRNREESGGRMPNGKASLGEEAARVSGLDDTEEENEREKEREERITSRIRGAKNTFFTRSSCSSVLI